MQDQCGIHPDRVAIYVRWSTDDQSEGTTLGVQLEGCRHYILSQGWQVNDRLIFIDDGYSGGNLNRPALTRLRKAVASNLVYCVVVFKLDRLSRSVIDTVNLVLQEWDSRTFVKSAREPVDTTSAIGKQFFYMLVSYAEWERNVIRERTHGGKLKRLQEGRNPGFKQPFGYERGEAPGSFRIVEHEVVVVRRVFELYLKGLGYLSIAHHLASEGFSFRGGRKFGVGTVLQILKNPLYVGDLVYRRKVVKHGSGGLSRVVQNPDAPLVVWSALVPPIIDRSAFEQAQRQRQERAAARVPRRALSSGHLLSGLARCHKCGYSLTARAGVWVKGKSYHIPYYVCSGQIKAKSNCECGYIKQEQVDSFVVDALRARYGGALGRRRLYEEIQAGQGQEVAAVRSSLTALRGELAALDLELNVIARDYRREKLTVDDYNAQKQVVEDDKAALTERLWAAESRLHILADGTNRAANLAALTTAIDQWETLNIEERKHILREFVSSLRLYKPPKVDELTVEVEWRTQEVVGAVGS